MTKDVGIYMLFERGKISAMTLTVAQMLESTTAEVMSFILERIDVSKIR